MTRLEKFLPETGSLLASAVAVPFSIVAAHFMDLTVAAIIAIFFTTLISYYIYHVAGRPHMWIYMLMQMLSLTVIITLLAAPEELHLSETILMIVVVPLISTLPAFPVCAVYQLLHNKRLGKNPEQGSENE